MNIHQRLSRETIIALFNLHSNTEEYKQQDMVYGYQFAAICMIVYK
jgi:hypothetical protein